MPALEQNSRTFPASQHVGIHRFKAEFYDKHASKEKIDALVVWTTIRTLIKGSIEAFQSPKCVLSNDDFVSSEKLGKNRCKISPDLHEYVYDMFLQYSKFIKNQHLWDDSDRFVSLLWRLLDAKSSNSTYYEKVRRSNVYVDEIQDYSQVEILLFFYLGGPGGLFLAGDPAQSVVEGTDFHFEAIRTGAT